MSIIDIIIFAGVIALIILFFLLRSTRVPYSVYKNKVIYSDHKEKPEKALFSPKYGLVGKPDFILHTKDGLLPLEIKHSIRPNQPYFSHIMQLTSYCLLLEEERGVKPKYGLLQYKDGPPFSISYTERNKSYLLTIMQQMRNHLDSGEGPKLIKKSRCEKCSYKEDCFRD